MDDAGSRLIFGSMGLGGGWGSGPLEAADIAAAHTAVEAALDIGIRIFDHADIYAHGKAEAAFGRVLAERPELRETIQLQSKCGIRLPVPGLAGQYDSSRAAIVAGTEESLRRLHTDHLDTLLIHRPDPLAPAEEIAEAFSRLRLAGKVRRLGVSNMSGEQMRWLQAALDEPLAVNQLEMSLYRRDWLESGVLVNHPEGAAVSFPHGTLEYCAAHAVELQAWGSLARGRYSGRPAEPAAGTADERRHRWRRLVRQPRMRRRRRWSPSWPGTRAARRKPWCWAGCCAIRPRSGRSWVPAIRTGSRPAPRPRRSVPR